MEKINIGDTVRILQSSHLLSGEEALVTNDHWSDALPIEAKNDLGGDAFRREDVELVRRGSQNEQ